MVRFEFARGAIDTASLQRTLRDPACGAYAAFEGWVRDVNEGQSVRALDYEAF
jgi:molybdopterin synthase catalytic subunit